MKLLSKAILTSTILICSLTLWTQDRWEVRDPVDYGFIDFADNKLIAYNLLGYGLVELIDKTSPSDSTNTHRLSISGYREYRREPLSSVIALSYEGGKSIRDFLEIGLSGRLYGMETSGSFTPGVGGSVWFTWHIINKERFKLSYDNGVGPNYFISAFPSGGTRFNFTSHYGFEFAWKTTSSWLSIRLSNIHISNADIRGRERNPALDAIGLRISTSW